MMAINFQRLEKVKLGDDTDFVQEPGTSALFPHFDYCKSSCMA